MYDRSSAATGVDEAKLHMFTRKQRPYDSIPPSQADLREHAKLKRAAYQVGVIWGQATCANPDIGSPPDKGWKNRSDVESVLDQTNFIAHQSKLPGTDQMVVQESLHQKAQMPSF